MAHFAQLDQNNEVLRIIVVDNNNLLNSDGDEVEQIGISFLEGLFGSDSIWKQTSYNNSFRFRYAGIGYTYDETLDAFIKPKPYNSWTLNSTTADWEAPVQYPDDGNSYRWDEDTLSWVQVPE